MTARVREILSWYGSDDPGTPANLARIRYEAGKNIPVGVPDAFAAR